jgi:class 3 adenylate cyclase/tetratricopeptide (TPR) repeat protein
MCLLSRSVTEVVGPRQERKVVTVLFCDLVGFTQRAEEMDPEDVASLLGPYHTRLKEELERHEGTVEKFIGDAVMALFGAPVAHEDDPERAVRAALAIRDFAEDEGIELRIGITTGEALVAPAARPERGETVATGDVVNTAARLQAAAPVNGILVSEKTYAATKDAIEYRNADSVGAKGKRKRVPVWTVGRARARVTLDRLHRTPLVGRVRELDLLVDTLARARAERQPQLVTLVGVPGIGKSRLVYELSQAVGREPELVSWRLGRCPPYGDGVTFWALAEIVKAQVGILETDTTEEAESKLGAAVPDNWVQTNLRPLVGLGVDGVGEGDRREEVFAAWRRFLEDIAAQRPLTLVFEDIHWADESLLAFVDYLVDWASAVPLLVLCTARPELLDRRPDWGGGKANALTLSLLPLSDEETIHLVRRIHRGVMPAETQATLLARAGGNPLYAEQYARLLEDRIDDELQLPETVQGIIAARLDALEPEQKALLQDAAVLGKVFWLRALTSISGAENRAAELALHGLERRGLVRREQDTSIEGDTEYAFLHVLVREVAYGQIPRVPRAEKHRLAAEWIASLVRPEDHAEMLAHHYGEALTLAHAAGVDTAALEEPAGRALRAAGDRAMELSAHAAALRFYEQALRLWGEDGIERARLLFHRARAAHFLGIDEARTDLLEEARNALLAEGDRESAAEAQMLEASALRSTGRGTDALDAARSAAALLADAPPSPAKGYMLANRARLLGLMSRGEEAVEVGRDALGIAEKLGLGEVKGMALNSIGVARVLMGDFEGLSDLEESLGLVLEHGSPFEIDRVYNNLGGGYLHAGQVERGYEALRTGLETAERLGLDVLWPKTQVADAAYLSGRWDEAARYADEFVAEGGSRLVALEPPIRLLRALLRLARDDLAGAASECALGLELLGQQQLDSDAQRILVELSRISISAKFALAEGRLEEAEVLADELRDALDKQVRFGGVEAIEVALLLADLGRPQDVVHEAATARPEDPWLDVAAAIARGELEHAAGRLAEMGARPHEAAVRLRAAAALVAGGRRVKADEQLDQALAFYRSVGATRYVRAGEALLAATAQAGRDWRSD